MKLTMDILVTLFVAWWSLFLLFLPMAFGGPGAADDRKKIFLALGIMYLPAAIFLGYKLFGANYFGVSADLAVAIALLVSTAVAFVFGLPRMALNTFRGVPNTDYFVGKSAVYLYGVRVKKALPASFEILDGHYTRDARHVFYGGRILAGAEPTSFEHVLDLQKSGEDRTTVFWKDKNRVYANGVALHKSQPATFKALSRSYGCDDTHVYYDWHILEDATPRQFVVLDSVMGRDNTNLYVRDQRLSHNADAATFRLFDNGEDTDTYGKDKSRVYFVCHWAQKPVVEIAGADPATFVPLERDYAKDDRNVYYRNSETESTIKLEGADPSSFEVIPRTARTAWDAKDRHRQYCAGKSMDEAGSEPD